MSQPALTPSERPCGNDRSKILQASWKFFKALARNTTIGSDTDQAQSVAVVDALKAYAGPKNDLFSWGTGSSRKTIEEYLDDGETNQQYNLIVEVAKRLKELDDILAEEGLPDEVTELLRRQAKDYANEAKNFDGGLSPIGRLLWALGNGAQVGWAVGIATTGPERALIPTELPQAWRTIFILSQYLLSPTVNNWQLLEITLQRSIMLLPNHIPYTLSFFLDVYGTAAYTWGAAGGALSLVAIVIGLKEQRGVRDRHILNRYLTNLNSENVIEMGSHLPTELQLKTSEVQELSMIINDVVGEYERGNATDNQYARMGSAGNTMFRSTKIVIEKRRVAKAPNPYRRQKYYILGMGDLLIGFVLWASSRNKAVLVVNLRWAAYYHYLLYTSVEDSAHTPKQTFEIFSMAGAMMIFGVPLVSAILLFDGPEAFLNTKRLFNHTAAMMVLQSTVVHLIGPTVLSMPKFARQVWTNLRNNNLKDGKVTEEPTMDDEAYRCISDILGMTDVSLEKLDERPTQPGLSEFLQPFLDALNEYEQLSKNEDGSVTILKGKQPIGNLATNDMASEPTEYSCLVDLMSASDIYEDTDYLAEILGKENREFESLKKILGMMTE